MARRSRDWNEGLAQDLRDQEFAREFLMAAMDEGVPIQIALGKVIRAMGVKEFAGEGADGKPQCAAGDSSPALSCRCCCSSYSPSASHMATRLCSGCIPSA